MGESCDNSGSQMREKRMSNAGTEVSRIRMGNPQASLNFGNTKQSLVDQ